MKQYFSLQPYSGLGKSGYRAKFVNRTDHQGRDLATIASAASAQGMMSADDLTYAFQRVMDESIRGACETGEIQRLGSYGSLMLNIHGTFDGIDDTFDSARHSLDFRFIPGSALKGVTAKFSLENIVSGEQLVIYEIAPVGYSGECGGGLDRYAVRDYDLAINTNHGLLVEGDRIDWQAENSAREIVTGSFTILKNESTRTVLAWPAGVPTALHRDELILVFTTHGGSTSGTQRCRKLAVPLFVDN